MTKPKQNYYELRFTDKKMFSKTLFPEILEHPPLRYFFSVYSEFAIETANIYEASNIERVEFKLTGVISGISSNHYIAFYNEVT